jgi:dTMP kinase
VSAHRSVAAGSPAPGRFISLEGIEGAGKSTLARALERELRERGVPVQLTREPGGTPLAEQLRALLLVRQGEQLSAKAETLLMFAARAVHLDNLIRPALQAGTWVLCDRYTDATRAYQGAGRGVPAAMIEQLAQLIHAELWPDRTLLLDLTVQQGAERARKRRASAAPDRFEMQDGSFFERVRAEYLRIAAAEPERVCVIDASGGEAEVLRGALRALADLLPDPAAAGRS